MRGMADDIDEFMNEIPDEGQDFDKADELLNLVRDNEQGMRDDDDDMIDDYKKGILKALNNPPDVDKEKETADHLKQMDEFNPKSYRSDSGDDAIKKAKANRINWDREKDEKDHRISNPDFYNLPDESDKQKRRRAARNAARRSAIKTGRASKGDGKDIHHLDGNPHNNTSGNTVVRSRSSNRSFARNSKAGKKYT